MIFHFWLKCLGVLKYALVHKNHSFASAEEDNVRFREMSHDSQIAKSYHMADTKVQYIIKFGIAHLKKLIYVRNTQFSYLFDETTNIQVK